MSNLLMQRLKFLYLLKMIEQRVGRAECLTSILKKKKNILQSVLVNIFV